MRFALQRMQMGKNRNNLSGIVAGERAENESKPEVGAGDILVLISK